jgi:hypothetical protein
MASNVCWPFKTLPGGTGRPGPKESFSEGAADADAMTKAMHPPRAPTQYFFTIRPNFLDPARRQNCLQRGT